MGALGCTPQAHDGRRQDSFPTTVRSGLAAAPPPKGMRKLKSVGASPRVSYRFAEGKDELLIQLQEEACPRWAEIHKRFSK